MKAGAKSKRDSPLEDALIVTPDVREVMESYELMKFGTSARRGSLLLILGESGVGKSYLLELFMKDFAPQETKDGRVSPGIYFMIPTAPTAISLYEAMLGALGDPKPSSGTRSQKKLRLLKQLRGQGVIALFIDELQHFFDRDSQRILFDASDALKEVIGHHPAIVVCAGLGDSKLVVDSNEQLRRRYFCTRTIRRFDWSVARSRREFRLVLRAFSKLLKGYEMPDMESDEVALRFYLATGGIMDFIHKLFHYVVALCEQKGSRKITFTLLSKAWRTVFYHAQSADTIGDPFSSDMSVDLEAKLDEAKRINGRVDPSAGRRNNRSRKRRLLSDIGL